MFKIVKNYCCGCSSIVLSNFVIPLNFPGKYDAATGSSWEGSTVLTCF